MGEFNSHRGADGTFSDDKARKDDKSRTDPKSKESTEAAHKDPKTVPAGNPLHSGEHPDPHR